MRRKRVLAVFLALIVTASIAAPAIAAGALDFSNEQTPEPVYHIDTLTLDGYNASWGSDLKVHNDNGDVEAFPGDINRSDDVDDIDAGHGRVNPFHIVATKINDPQLDEFPRNDDEDGDNKASSLDASEWTTSGASMSDVSTAEGVNAVEYSASAAEDSATYNNWSSGESSFIQTDASKRVFSAFYNVDSASGASVVNVTIHDATDSDTVVVELYNSSGSTSDTDVGATSTGDGKVMQVKLSDLSGGSNIDEIGKLVVNADGSANVDFSRLDVGLKKKILLGEKRVDTDSDDDFEINETYETQGRYNITSLSTMDPILEDATIEDLQMPVDSEAGDYGVEMRIHQSDDPSNPSFDTTLNVTYRLELPNYIDTAYSGVDLDYPQAWADSRFLQLGYKEGVSESTDLDEVDGFTDKTGSLSGEDSEWTIDSTISPGDDNVVRVRIELTQGEFDSLFTTTESESTGGGGIFGGSGGGFWSMVFSLPGLIVAAAIGLGGRFAGVW